MPDYRLPYGKKHLDFSLSDSYDVEILAPAAIPPAADPIGAVNQALDAPVGGARLDDHATARTVAIAINDKTRPVPLAVLLPPLLDRLAKLGIPDTAITLIIAPGTHAPMRPEEFASVVPGEILARYQVNCHDCNDRSRQVYLGATQRNTPIWTNRQFAEADLRIVVGNFEPHQFMGFSGGVKTAAIGLAGKETVNRNHSMMLDPLSDIARYDDNPARQDVEEIGEKIGVQFALNAIINPAFEDSSSGEKPVVSVVAGEPKKVMRVGIPRVLELYRATTKAPFDLIIASPGGHPKDINLYQAQKGLAHATLVTRPGGTVILAAACPEGTGSKAYEDWVIGMASHADVLARFASEGYRIGPHKAFQISRDASRVNVLFVSDLPPEFARQLLLNPVASLDEALRIATNALAPSARIGIMPWANSCIPAIAA